MEVIKKFQKAAIADGHEVTENGKIDEATKKAMHQPGKNIVKWVKSEIGDIGEFQRKNHMLITGEIDYFTIERLIKK